MILLDKEGNEIGRSDPPKEPYNLVPYVDPRTQSSVTIVDLYTKEGKHLKSTMSYEDGTVISEEGRNPNKDVGFFNLRNPPWSNE